MKRSLSLRLSRKDFGGKNNMETFGATITIIHLVMTAITILFGWRLVGKPRKPMDDSGYVLQVIYNVLIAAVLVFAYLKG
ncbi:hypothetical protein HG429_004025 [Candidatus Saccharibacteria bacterium]|nr:hypothetical protein [Candidatus Saccharibacteria bacterium]DAJ84117.1 MAG TPA: hypothetical protein [Caudoviricetes sp.]